MMGALTTMLSAVAPVLIGAALGYFLLGRKSIDVRLITTITTDVGTPSLVLYTLSSTRIPPDALATTALAAILSLLCFAGLGLVALKVAKLRVRTFLPALTFPNVGNLGLPLIYLAFGQQGLGYAIAFFTITSVAQFTLGQGIAMGGTSWKAILRVPVIYALIIGIVITETGITLPGWVTSTLQIMSGLTVPLMLLMLGSALARLRVNVMRRAASVAVLRIGMGCLVGVAVCALLHITGVARAVVILQCGMPVAVYCYLFAERWQNQPEEVAGTVVVSTVVSVVTIPALLEFLLLSP